MRRTAVFLGIALATVVLSGQAGATNPPVVTITLSPPQTTNATTATFAFTATDSDDAALSVECALDNDAFASCESPVTYQGLNDGGHDFTARARDAAGNLGSASFAWRVDTTAPEIYITDKPEDPSNAADATITFAAADWDDPIGGITVSCALDAAVLAPCRSPATYAGLSEGRHTFWVRAGDLAGNAASASFSWTVDTTPPRSSFTTSEDALLISAYPVRQDAVSGTTLDNGSGIERIDVTFAPPVGSPVRVAAHPCFAAKTLCAWDAPAPVLPGPYIVTVRAVDVAGNVEAPGPPPITVLVV